MRNRARKRPSPAPGKSQEEKTPRFLDKHSTKLCLGAAVVLLSALATLCYANSLENGFVWDDHQQVVMNSALRPGAPFSRLFGANIWGNARPGSRQQFNYYRPLQMVAYRLAADASGFDARVFHAVNLLFDVLAVLLTFALFWRLTSRLGVSFAAAAVFATHPIHSEAVDWVAALPDIGCTAFFLLAFLSFVLTREDVSRPQQTVLTSRTRFLYMASSCAAFAATLLWKETGIVFPFIVMAYVILVGQAGAFASKFRDAANLSLPYWAILAAYLLLRLRVLGFIVTSQRNWVLTPFQLALTTINLFLNYWLKLFAPIHLNAYYVFSPVQKLEDPRAIAAILFLLAAVVGILYITRRTPLAAFAALWVCITIIPVLNVYAVGRNVFSERYLYLPSVGFCLLVVLAVSWAGRLLPVRLRWPAGAIGLASVLAFFIQQNISHNPVWKNDSTLFTQTLERSPNAPFVQNMVAAVQPNDREGRISAESHYLRAISLAENESPSDLLEVAIANEGLASVYAGRGEFDRALHALHDVRVTDPQDPEVDGEEGLILAQAGRWSQAEADLRKAVAIEPNNANVLNALGLVAWQHHHDLDEAASYFSRALAIHTDADDFRASLHSNLGAIYGEQGRFQDAIAQFSLALKITPNDPEYLTNLGKAYAAIGRLNDARKKLQAALAVAPDYQPALAALQQLLGP
jgi:Flp pilus assembly protein TadD